jgi:hypothetical protein
MDVLALAGYENMDRRDLNDLENALGIYKPWAIQEVTYNASKRRVNILVALPEKRSFFRRKDDGNAASEEWLEQTWQYRPIGGYQSFVTARVPRSLTTSNQNTLNRDIINSPAFVGDPRRTYSNYLRQQVALAQYYGQSLDWVVQQNSIDSATLSTIISDLDAASSSVRSIAHIPTEIDNQWHKIATGELQLKTAMLPLRLMITKLGADNVQNLTRTNDNGETELANLRKFFLANASQLGAEIDQICALKRTQNSEPTTASRAKRKLTLPGIKHPVWHRLLSGQLQIKSESMPFNLLMARQQIAFLRAESDALRVKAISPLRNYLHKNYRLLTKELISLNKAMVQRPAQPALPAAEHQIWQKILNDDTYIPTDHMAYRLLIARLRAQISSSPSPIAKLKAAEQIRIFMGQNRQAMQSQLDTIIQQAAS